MEKPTSVKYIPLSESPKKAHLTPSRFITPFSLSHINLLNANLRYRINSVSSDSQNSPYSPHAAESPYFAFSMKKAVNPDESTLIAMYPCSRMRGHFDLHG